MEERSYGAARGAVWVAAPLHLAVAAAFAFAGPLLEHAERPLDGLDVLGRTALFAVYAAPALLALLALRGRPLLLVAASALSFPLAFTAFSGVSLVLLLPATAYLASFARAGLAPQRGPAPLVAVIAAVAFGVAAFGALLAASEPVCWGFEVRADGTRSSWRVPVDEVSFVEDGQRVFSSSATAGVGIVEAGGGCGERPTAPAALASLGLVALLLAGGARFGRTPPRAA